MTAADATRLAGEPYRTRLARGEAATLDDKTRLAQEGYESRLARDAADGQPDTGEFYKVGEKIGGRYEVSAIHHGELGVVYGCFDHQTKLPRALKTVRARHASDQQVLSLFESEATVWISLEKHPYIVRAYLVERFKNPPTSLPSTILGEFHAARRVSGPTAIKDGEIFRVGLTRLRLGGAKDQRVATAAAAANAIRS